jgi:hypothetical protein
MPRILALCALVVGGCVFKADYEGELACSDGKCPAGLMCNLGRNLCLVPDAATPMDAPDAPDAPDASPPQTALNCAEPGILAATGGMAMNTTAGRGSRMSSSCGGFVNNGPDATYKITLPAGKMLTVAVDALKAYVVASCVPAPSTPACLGAVRATPGNPITVSPAAGPSFIVVDEENPGATGGPFRLTVTVN